MTFDQKLHELIGQVENSHLSRKEKDDVYASISLGLHAAVWPVLVSHMPEDKLAQVAADTSRVTPEAYAGLVRLAIDDPKTEFEIEGLMQAALSGAEKVLKEKFIL